jgi:hypothetical protein
MIVTKLVHEESVKRSKREQMSQRKKKTQFQWCISAVERGEESKAICAILKVLLFTHNTSCEEEEEEKKTQAVNTSCEEEEKKIQLVKNRRTSRRERKRRRYNTWRREGGEEEAGGVGVMAMASSWAWFCY